MRLQEERARSAARPAPAGSGEQGRCNAGGLDVGGSKDDAPFGPLRFAIGTRAVPGDVTADGVDIVLRGHSIRSLAAEVSGFGAYLQVHDPPELREALAEVGRELVAQYGRGAEAPIGFSDEAPSR